MSRNLSSPMIAQITSGFIIPAFLFAATFKSQTCYVWSGGGTLVYGGNSYLGVGSLGEIGPIIESSEIQADGTSVTLSGIDATLLGETLTDVQLGAPASLTLAFLDGSNNALAAYPLFVGQVDQPSIQPGLDKFSITLKIENKLINLQRASNRRYTSADQNLYYPSDMAFRWVEQLNDQALVWGG